MSEFLFLYRGADRGGSPEQLQQRMQKWTAWMKELTAKGHMKDQGHPLERSGKVVKGKQKTVIDGPFAETKELIGGYWIINVKSKAEAIEWAKRAPAPHGENQEGEIEVRQFYEFTDFLPGKAVQEARELEKQLVESRR